MKTKHDIKRWKSLYEEGLTYYQIAEKFGTDFRLVHYHLKKLGVRGRKPSYYNSGEKNFFWKDGTTIEKKKGYTSYRLIYSPTHPFRNKQNKVREHRLVMEKYLGRFLQPQEVVDHIDGNGLNNDIKNLKLYSSNAEHLKATKKNCVPRWTEAGKKAQEKAVKISAVRRREAASERNYQQVLSLTSKYPHGSSIPRTDVEELRRLRHRIESKTCKTKKEYTQQEDLLLQIRTFLNTCRTPSRRNPAPIRTIV